MKSIVHPYYGNVTIYLNFKEEQAGVNPMSTRLPVSTPTEVDAEAKRFAYRPVKFRRGPISTLAPTCHQDSTQDELQLD